MTALTPDSCCRGAPALSASDAPPPAQDQSADLTDALHCSTSQGLNALSAAGVHPPSVQGAHDLLLQALQDQSDWERRARAAKDLLNEMVRSRREAAQLSQQYDIKCAGPSLEWLSACSSTKARRSPEHCPAHIRSLTSSDRQQASQLMAAAAAAAGCILARACLPQRDAEGLNDSELSSLATMVQACANPDARGERLTTRA